MKKSLFLIIFISIAFPTEYKKHWKMRGLDNLNKERIERKKEKYSNQVKGFDKSITTAQSITNIQKQNKVTKKLNKKKEKAQKEYDAWNETLSVTAKLDQAYKAHRKWGDDPSQLPQMPEGLNTRNPSIFFRDYLRRINIESGFNAVAISLDGGKASFLNSFVPFLLSWNLYQIQTFTYRDNRKGEIEYTQDHDAYTLWSFGVGLNFEVDDNQLAKFGFTLLPYQFKIQLGTNGGGLGIGFGLQWTTKASAPSFSKGNWSAIIPINYSFNATK